jgi:hypothetical protein
MWVSQMSYGLAVTKIEQENQLWEMHLECAYSFWSCFANFHKGPRRIEAATEAGHTSAPDHKSLTPRYHLHQRGRPHTSHSTIKLTPGRLSSQTSSPQAGSTRRRMPRGAPLRGKKPSLQHRVGQLTRQRPNQPRHLRPLQIILDRAAGDAQHPPNLPRADTFASQSQCVSYLPHRQLSLRRHQVLLVVDHEKSDARVADPIENAGSAPPGGRN